jgi:hypothetical protein
MVDESMGSIINKSDEAAVWLHHLEKTTMYMSLAPSSSSQPPLPPPGWLGPQAAIDVGFANVGVPICIDI